MTAECCNQFTVPSTTALLSLPSQSSWFLEVPDKWSVFVWEIQASSALPGNLSNSHAMDAGPHL